MFGLLVTFTIKQELISEFDAYLDSLIEKMKCNEPNTLLYVSDQITDIANQRLLYELYKDHDSFMEHESQPYIKGFLLERNKYMSKEPEIKMLRMLSMSNKIIGE